jgi:hypothetical protein
MVQLHRALILPFLISFLVLWTLSRTAGALRRKCPGPHGEEEDCDKTPKKCCPSLTCVCCKEICGIGSMRLLRLLPESPPILAFFEFSGFGPGAPCCGQGCTMPQCLDLIDLELKALSGPLQIQKKQTGESETEYGLLEDEGPDPSDCCGPNCSSRGCFSYLIYGVIELQNPIRITREGTQGSNAPDDESSFGLFTEL